MANEYLLNKTDITSVANAIRSKTKKTTGMVFPSGFVSAISGINCDFYTFKKVGTMEVGYNKTTLSITSLSNWQSVTLNDIYFVPVNFIITATDSTTAGTYNINKTYSNGTITAWRDSIPGKVGITFTCDVYVYVATDTFGKIYKIGTNQPLTYGSGVTINISSTVKEYESLTADNFYLDLKKIDINVTAIGGGSANVIKTYDATTGAFNFSRASISFSGSMNNYCDVYVYVPY